MDLATTYKNIVNRLKLGGIEAHDFEARWIIEERTPYRWSDMIANPDSDITPEQEALIAKDVEQRLNAKPLSRIYGVREFWGLDFELSEDTLDPRPDTELIIDLALQRFEKNQPIRILDLGTGTGCILIALLSEFRNAQGIAVDISQGAVTTAQKNAAHHNVNKRAEILCGSWLDPVNGHFDLIVSNPPYIANDVIPTLSDEVQNHDPILALDGGFDGLAPYKILFSKIKPFLNPGGIGLFEIGYDQQQDVTRLSEEAGFALRTVHLDLARNPRVVEISCGDK